MTTSSRCSRQRSGFVSGRLVEARLARGLSQTGLATITGLKKQSINNYELGKQEPREDSIDIIATTLKFPSSYFFKPIGERSKEPIHFRSLARASQADRDQVTCRLAWVEDMLDYLDEYIDPLVPAIPDYGRGRKPSAISNSEIDEIATKVRRDFNLKDGPISNITWLLQNKGILIVKMAGAEFESEDLDAFSTWLRGGRFPVIILSARPTTLCRQRMNLAHELGHLVLHRGICAENREELKLMESQAFRLGSAFLLPETSYFKSISYPSLDAFLAVKPRWKVAIRAQIERCYRAKAISEERRRLMYIQCSKKGWTTREPLDDEMIVVEPTYLKDSLQLIASEGIQDGPDIMQAMALSENDLASFAGLDESFFLGKEIKNTKPSLKLVKR